MSEVGKIEYSPDYQSIMRERMGLSGPEIGPMFSQKLIEFVSESNKIEGIHKTLIPEVKAHSDLLGISGVISIDQLVEFVKVIQPNAVLRDKEGLNVRVGDYYPPKGGPEIKEELHLILQRMGNFRCMDAQTYQLHHAFERLHPFTDGNGRTGRALWLWMTDIRRLHIGFLHAWYYQSLRFGRELGE